MTHFGIFCFILSCTDHRTVRTAWRIELSISVPAGGRRTWSAGGSRLAVESPSACCSWDISAGRVPAGSPSRGGDVTVYVTDINQPCLPTPFYSVLVSVSVFMALSTVSVFMALSTLFRSINSPDNSSLSHSVPLVLILSYWSFQLSVNSALLVLSSMYLFIKVSLSPDLILCGLLGLKHQVTS